MLSKTGHLLKVHIIECQILADSIINAFCALLLCLMSVHCLFVAKTLPVHSFAKLNVSETDAVQLSNLLDSICQAHAASLQCIQLSVCSNVALCNRVFALAPLPKHPICIALLSAQPCSFCNDCQLLKKVSTQDVISAQAVRQRLQLAHQHKTKGLKLWAY